MARATLEPAIADFDPAEHHGKRVALGLDLSQSRDITALAAAVETGSFTLRGETAAKHAFALGRTGTAPPTPAIGGTAALDAVAAPADLSRAAHQIVLYGSAYPVTASVGKLTVAPFSATVDGGLGVMQFPAGEIAVSDSAVNYLVLYALSDVERPLLAENGQPLLGEDGQSLTSTVPAGSYIAVPQPALEEAAMSEFVILREFTTPAADGTYPPVTTPPSGDGGGGYGGGGRYQQNQVAIQ